MTLRKINELARSNFAHYIVAGGITFATDYGIFLVSFYAIGVSAVIANSISFTVSLIVNFSLNKLWVFSGDHKKRKEYQFALFFTLAVFNLLFTNTGIFLLTKINIPAYIAKLALIAVTTLWNYIIYRHLIFRNK